MTNATEFKTRDEFLAAAKQELENSIDQFGVALSPEARRELVEKLTKLHEFQWDYAQEIQQQDDKDSL